jgi:hypothetical protein
MLLIVMSLWIMLILVPPLHGQANSIRIETDQSVYAIWHVGGNINVTAIGLAPNITYHLWLQRPTEQSTTLTNTSLRGAAEATANLVLSPTDPSGTYFLSLSNSSLRDYRLAFLHFGVLGASKSSYQRTESVIVSGGGFAPNSTVTLEFNTANQSSSADVKADPSGAVQYVYNTQPSTPNGTLSIMATGPSYDSNQTVSATYIANITPAKLVFNMQPLSGLQRTNTIVVNATLTYPGGEIISPQNLTAPVNMTLSTINFTISRAMNFSDTSRSWYSKYFIPFNGTIGAYNIVLMAEDPFGNGGKFTASTNIDRAKFRIFAPESVKESPGKVVDIALLVMYPDGTLLTDQYGGQVTVLTNSTTGEGGHYEMFYNSTDLKWHLFYTAPELGMNFGKVVTFSFHANDGYGNSGTAQNAYKITVGADTATLALAVIVAAVVPVALIVWAILTITRRRRRFKP